MNPGAAGKRLIVALDCDAPEALRLAEELHGTVRWLKVGMTLFYREGPGIVTALVERGYDVFLDLKLHDIPHQARGAAASVAGLGAKMLTVHASGGPDMIAAAREGAHVGAADAGLEPPSILAVTVLTSIDDATLRQVGVVAPAGDQVLALASMAIRAGADGLVCSPLETRSVRATVGLEPQIVTPGVRPVWSEAGDQARITTPHDALAAGASHLVIGRPITGAPRPADAARRIIAEMEEVPA